MGLNWEINGHINAIMKKLEKRPSEYLPDVVRKSEGAFHFNNEFFLESKSVEVWISSFMIDISMLVTDKRDEMSDSDVGDIVMLVTLWWWLIWDVVGRIIMLSTFFVMLVIF